jgi:hypothetical protein
MAPDALTGAIQSHCSGIEGASLKLLMLRVAIAPFSQRKGSSPMVLRFDFRFVSHPLSPDIQKREQRFRYSVLLDNPSPHLVGHIGGHIPAPAFNGIEGDDANRLAVLAREQIADQGLAVSGVLVGLAPRAPDPAKVIQHEVTILLRPMRGY